MGDKFRQIRSFFQKSEHLNRPELATAKVPKTWASAKKSRPSNSMQFFHQTINVTSIIGIHRLKPSESRFNRRNIGISLVFGINVIQTAYTLFDAKAFEQYEEYFFTLTTLLCVYNGYYVLIMKTTNVFQLLDNTAEIYKKRKQNITFKSNYMDFSIGFFQPKIPKWKKY